MSIIYSYPTVQPAADDLLIGTDVGSDNITKSFTISSIASLIGEIASAGTVNSVQIATDAFLSAVGGPITTSGTITIGLTALGTPSANTFLRGDNRWVTPTVSAGIYAFNQNTQITDDISSINFIGEGVTATSSADGSVTVQINGGQAGVESVTSGTGITVNQSTGDIEITNTGVTRLIPGSNITLSANTGDITISSSGGTGGVTIVNAGTGLTIESGTAQANPTIGVDYTGINNFIRLGENPEVATASDFMLFEDVGTGNVKSTTLGTIPTSALSLVETSINTVDSNAVKHNTDIYPSIPTVFQVITLTQTEYNDIATKNGNTLYLIGGGVTQITKTLAITNNINGTEYTIGGDQAGLPKTGAQGSAYNFTTTVTANPGFEFSEPLVIQNAQGIYDTNGTVYTILSGTVSAVDPGTCTANLIIDASGLVTQDGAIQNTTYQITSTTNTISGTCGTSFTSSNFGVAVSLVAGQNTDQWEIINPVYTYSPASGTLNGSTPVTCTVTGTVREKSYTLQYNITDSNTNGVYGTDYTIVNSNPSGANFSGGTAPLTQTISGKFSDTYNIATTYLNVGSSGNNTVIGSASLGTVNGNVISGITGTLGDSAPSGVTLSQTISSTTSAIAGPAQFQLTTLNQNVQSVDDGDSIQNKGFTYADYVQYRINNGPLNNITTLNQYILVSEGDVVKLSYAEPTITPNSGFYIRGPFSTYINITDGTNNFVNTFTAVADASYSITVTQTGGVTNRRGVSGRSANFVVNESEACGLTLQTINTYLSKPSNPTAPVTPWVPEVNNYVWAHDYDYNSFADGWYRANLTVTWPGTLPTNPGKYQLLSNRVNAASACPADGTAILSLDDQVNGSSPWYTISSTYTVTPPGEPTGDPISYTNTPVTAILGSTVTFVTTAIATPGYYWSSGPTITPAGNNSVTITADSQVQANVTVQGDVAALFQVRTTEPLSDAPAACGDDADQQDAWKTGGSILPTADEILYNNNTGTVFADSGFYKIFGTTKSFEVDASGVISNVAECPVQNTVFTVNDGEQPSPTLNYDITASYTINGGNSIPGGSAQGNVGDTVVFTIVASVRNGYYETSPLVVTYPSSQTIIIPEPGSSNNSVNFEVTGGTAPLQQIFTSTKSNDLSTVCDLPANTTSSWKTGSSVVAVGDIVYTQSNVNSSFRETGYYKEVDGSGNLVVLSIDNTGAIIEIFDQVCNLIPVEVTPVEQSAVAACSGTPQEDAWKTGSGLIPQNGQTLYSNFAGTTFADPGYYVILGTNRSFEVDSNGIISNVQSC